MPRRTPPPTVDPAIIALAEALARKAAREDHEAALAESVRRGGKAKV